MPRIHHGKRIDMHELVLDHALVRLAQHRLGIVDADDAVGGRIIRERNAGADADVEDAPADALGRRDRGLAAGVEHRAEDEIVDRRPTRIGLRDRADIDFVRHRPFTRGLAALPLPLWGEGWGEGVRSPSIDLNPSPHPSPYGRGSRPSSPLALISIRWKA